MRTTTERVCSCGRSALRVLVVDDHADYAESTAMVLRAYGHQPEIARDGPAALTAARLHPPDVVLLDIALPRMNGWELAKRIKEQAGETTPVLIAITGWGREEDHRHSAESGIDCHLTKPVDLEALDALLQRLPKVSEAPHQAAKLLLRARGLGR